jgi:hypothetical protein
MTEFTIIRPAGNIIIKLPTPATYFYRFLCVPTGKCYIGRTNNPTRRITEHLTGTGSPSLLEALVDYGRTQFEITLLDTSNAPDPILNTIEDHYIHQFNALHPEGFNMRLNTPITPVLGLSENYEHIDLNSFDVSAKYVFNRANHLIFTVGEFTCARDYQILTNVCSQLEGARRCPIKKRRGYGFNYYELKCPFAVDNSQTQFVVGEVYDLRLKYYMLANKLSIL